MATAKSAAKPPRKTAAKRAPAAPKRKPAAARKPDAKPAAAKTQPHVGLISAITVGLIAAGSLAALAVRRLFTPGNAEHAAPDLALDQPHPGPDHRAPIAFRPDPTAPVPASEREALRPATVPLVTH